MHSYTNQIHSRHDAEIQDITIDRREYTDTDAQIHRYNIHKAHDARTQI